MHLTKVSALALLTAAAPVLAQSLGAGNYAASSAMAVPTNKPSFADEFAGPRIDLTRWRFDTRFNKAGWFNNEKQYYAANRAKNARIEDGALVIEAHRETADKRRFSDTGGQAYTSAKLIARERLGFGFYEIRAKLPCARGTWPAIWMLAPDGKWPDEGEIDIMEMVGWDAGTVLGTLHSGAFNHAIGTQRGASVKLADACTAFHRYQLDWRPDAITIGVDGTAFMRVADPGGGKPAWPFTRPYDLILNLAIGGDWGGAKGIDDAALPQRMTVDYVRHWAHPPAR